jgi:hypothetical protein
MDSPVKIIGVAGGSCCGKVRPALFTFLVSPHLLFVWSARRRASDVVGWPLLLLSLLFGVVVFASSQRACLQTTVCKMIIDDLPKGSRVAVVSMEAFYRDVEEANILNCNFDHPGGFSCSTSRATSLSQPPQRCCFLWFFFSI